MIELWMALVGEIKNILLELWDWTRKTVKF